MIVPVGFSLDRREVLEDYVYGLKREVVSRPEPRDLRLRVELFDTEARVGLGVWARVLLDPEAEHGHEWATLVQMRGHVPLTELRREYLTELRDHLNELLSEGSKSE